MEYRRLTTESRFFTRYGWARFMGAGFFGVDKNGGIK